MAEGHFISILRHYCIPLFSLCVVIVLTQVLLVPLLSEARCGLTNA